MRELVDEQLMNLGSEILVNVFLILAMAQMDLGVVIELDVVIGVVDLTYLLFHPPVQHGREARRTLHVVLHQVRKGPTKQIRL